jgi:hypothetical protein
MSRLPYGTTLILAATMAIAVVQLEVTSSAGATRFQADDAGLQEPLNDVNRSNKSNRLAWQRSSERGVTYLLYGTDAATATRITLEKPQPVAPAAGMSDQAWESSSDIRDTCEPLVSPMIAEELKIAPRRCPT